MHLMTIACVPGVSVDDALAWIERAFEEERARERIDDWTLGGRFHRALSVADRRFTWESRAHFGSTHRLEETLHRVVDRRVRVDSLNCPGPREWWDNPRWDGVDMARSHLVEPQLGGRWRDHLAPAIYEAGLGFQRQAVLEASDRAWGALVERLLGTAQEDTWLAVLDCRL